MRKLCAILVATTTLSFGSMANASELGGIALGVKASTLGAGVELNYPISSRITINVGINKYSASISETADGIDYDADLNLQTIALLANFHPFAGSFRITAGAMINSNELSMTADPNATSYTIGNTTYPAALVGNLEAKVDFKRIAPYAGIGFGHSASSGLGFMFDIGVLMQGDPQVDISAGPAVSQADIEQEEANAEDDIKGFTMYPVVSAGINYRF